MLAGSISASHASDAHVEGSGYVEHLLIWSWRRVATGRVECPVMAKEFTDVCGEDAREVFATLCTFLKALGFASRRRLNLRAPGWPTMTADERRMLTLLGAAQAGDRALFTAHLCWLARPERRHELQIATCALATALAANNLVLSLPQPSAPAIRERSRPAMESIDDVLS